MIDTHALARLALFADLAPADLQEVALSFDEESHPRGHRLLREGLAGGAFHVITSGEASVRIAGADRARLVPGDFAGEISILTGVPAVADVVVVSEELRAAVLPGAELRPLLRRHPDVAIRMLETGTRRLARANLWTA